MTYSASFLSLLCRAPITLNLRDKLLGLHLLLTHQWLIFWEVYIRSQMLLEENRILNTQLFLSTSYKPKGRKYFSWGPSNYSTYILQAHLFLSQRSQRIRVYDVKRWSSYEFCSLGFTTIKPIWNLRIVCYHMLSCPLSSMYSSAQTLFILAHIVSVKTKQKTINKKVIFFTYFLWFHQTYMVSEPWMVILFLPLWQSHSVWHSS